MPDARRELRIRDVITEDARWERLGLLHLEDKPEELSLPLGGDG